VVVIPDSSDWDSDLSDEGSVNHPDASASNGTERHPSFL
jgi:hypothetical protein